MRTLGKSILAGILLFAGSASAATIEAKFNTVSLYTDIGVSVNKSTNSTPNVQNLTARAGVLAWSRTGGDYAGPGIGGLNSSFSTFCCELTQYINYGGVYEFDVKTLDQVPQPGSYVVGNHTGTGMGATAATLIQNLWAAHRFDVVDGVTAAAFQAAVWEIVYDSGSGTLSVDNGHFMITSGSNVATVANGWLSTLPSADTLPTIGGLSNLTVQDQIYFVSDTPIPGPRLSRRLPRSGAAA